ncbi:MAG: helix-turn-helix domain containing protein [Eubacteriales bacterium]|nr:helix-turn-helix domain containing protein [Eubacteriales bacterium]
MSARQYTPRELDILEGVLKLVKQGEPIHALKVAEIAAAAGVGKGTVYEYFDSKEEILAETLCYVTQREACRCLELVRAQEGFDAKFAAMVDAAEENLTNRLSNMNQLASLGTPQDMAEMMRRCGRDPHMAAEATQAVFAELAAVAQAEGLSGKQDDGYTCFVLRAALAGYIYQRGCCGRLGEPTREETLRDCLRMVKGALARPRA